MADQPFLASNSFNGDGVTTVWEFSFEGLAVDAPLTAKPYINSADVRAELITTVAGEQVTTQIPTVFESANTLRVEPAVPVGTLLRIYRKTENRFPLVNYQDLQSIGASDLDLANRQAVYIVQEARDAARGAGNIGAESLALALGAAQEAADSAADAEASAAAAQIVALAASAVQEDLGAVATALSSSNVVLTDPTAIVAIPVTLNKADPDVVDPALPTIADQLHRVYNPGGALSPQSPGTLGTFAVTKKYDVTALSTYTISVDNAPLGFRFYFVGTPVVRYFNTDGSWHSDATTGFTRGPKDRSVVFTVPSGAERVAFIMRDFTSFSNASPMTAAALEVCMDNLMMAEGTEVPAFTPYSDGSFVPDTSLFDPVGVGALSVYKQGEFFYVRSAAQASSTHDVVWRVRGDYAPDYNRVDSRTGVVDFYGIRFIAKTRPDAIAAFNQSTLVHSNGMDESCPVQLNGMYLAGGHGVIGYTATMAAHGKTGVDIGSIWSDGTSQWVLYRVDSTAVVTMVRRYTGTLSAWAISSATFGSSTLTHVSGATNVANISMSSSAQVQHIPILRDYLTEFRVDNTPIVQDKEYRGNRAVLAEIYTLMNAASQQDYLISQVGTASPDYTNAAIVDQIRIYNEYEWNDLGAMSVRAAQSAKTGYTRTAGMDYWGGIQLQRLSLSVDSTPGMHAKVALYVPEVAPVLGLDLENIADITSNALVVRVSAALCDNPADPASHFLLLGRDGADLPVSGHLFGYSRDVGLGVPATRAAAVTDVMFFSTAEKQYPVAIDNASGNAVADDIDVVTSFRAPFLPTDSTLTVPGVVVTMDGKVYVYITTHQAHTNKLVVLPARLAGQPATVIKGSAAVTVLDEFVTNGGVRIDASGYGDVVLRLG